ncbi:MAG: hypothetical protein ABJP90_16645 [Paracoccaceae bacterium]
MSVSLAKVIDPTPVSNAAERLPTVTLAETLPAFGGMSGTRKGVVFDASMPGREIVTVPNVPSAGNVAIGGEGIEGNTRLLSVTSTLKVTETAEAGNAAPIDKKMAAENRLRKCIKNS